MSTEAEGSGMDEAGLEISERAAEEIIDLLEREDMSPEQAGLRLFVKQGGCAGLSYGLRFDHEPDEDDTVYRDHGIQVFVDPASMNYVQQSTLDFEGGLQGEGFIVDNPNVVSECGCGESLRT